MKAGPRQGLLSAPHAAGCLRGGQTNSTESLRWDTCACESVGEDGVGAMFLERSWSLGSVLAFFTL